MPQMAPMNWYILFILFIAILIMFNMMNFFITMPPPSLTKAQTMKMNYIMWKW